MLWTEATKRESLKAKWKRRKKQCCTIKTFTRVSQSNFRSDKLDLIIRAAYIYRFLFYSKEVFIVLQGDGVE